MRALPGPEGIDLAPWAARHAFPSPGEVDDELARIAATHPRCRLERLGLSRGGRPVTMLIVPGGPRHVVVVGGPHPNEPAGHLTVLALARLLTRGDNLTSGIGCTWHLVGCIDPDGAALNPWTGMPLDLTAYHRHFYRPPLAAQPEWTFPAPGFSRPLPETTILHELLTAVRPEVYVDLHNADFGGAFFVVNRPHPALSGALRDAAARHRIPLGHEGIDTIGWAKDGPAVHVMPPVGELVITPPGADGPSHGASSLHHLPPGAIGVMPEVPLWPARTLPAPSTGPGTPGYPELMRRTAALLHERCHLLEELLDRALPHLPGDAAVFTDAAADTLKAAASCAELWRTMAAGPVTRDQYAAAADGAACLPLRAAGMLLRATATVPVPLNSRPAFTGAERTVPTEAFESWDKDLRATAPAPYPLHAVVGLQTATALTAAAIGP
ncbi:M14 family zinc carboxypeptidase [Streptomyces sp. MI02-7b]|uniref:M14 family zinc carboxypeptidase n=1 Tax=Streptomyces sp. MI02-7b TaxID=462941 RepID=UPI0029A9B36B|nr:M14 family zinc carboxypeptidase [Streptomyces sp. MI02-7b]MDX3072606.1 M14 family zinc carboxypeptidase [Streptomyces sp. MI02-7b]